MPASLPNSATARNNNAELYSLGRTSAFWFFTFCLPPAAF